MDTISMISEIKTTCKTLERQKAALTKRVQEIDEKLTNYGMAIRGLEQTVKVNKQAQKTWSRKAKMIEYNGERKSVSAWAKQLGLSTQTLSKRLNQGWPISKAFSAKKYRGGKSAKQKKSQKVFMYDSYGNVIRQFSGGLGEASRDLKLPVSTIEKIIANMSKEDQLRVRNYYLAYVG